MEQLDLLGQPATVVASTTPDIDSYAPRTRKPSWAMRKGTPSAWWRFHVDHPAVADRLVALARPLVAAGHRRLSIAMLWETLRYEYLRGSRPDEPGPRFNNNHRAMYARFLMEVHADLAGVFETRESQAEGADDGDGGTG